MTFTSNVQPRRRVRPEKHQPWYCDCLATEGQSRVLVSQEQPASVKRCYVCLAVRP